MAAGLSTHHAPPLDLPFRFLAIAVVGFALLALVYPWHTPLLLGSFYDPHLVTFVHVNTLGVIGATIFGASYQLLPVVLGVPLGSVRLARLSWWLYVPGLLLFLVGLSTHTIIALAVGGSLAFGAFATYVCVVVGTLARERRPGLMSWHVAASMLGLGYAAVFGLLLAISKRIGFLEDLTLPIMGAHATLMLAGWVAPLHMGVAYCLVGMFTLSEDHLVQPVAWAALAAAVLGAWAMAIGLLFPDLVAAEVLRLAGATGILLGQVLFVAQLMWLYRHRRRRVFDVHMPFALTSACYAVLVPAVLLFGFISRRPLTDSLWVAAGWWAIAGWAQMSIQGFFFKIATFLTWLHRYAPLAGRQRVPRLEDLYSRPVAIVGGGIWSGGVLGAGVAALSGQPWLAQASGVALSLGAAMFVANALRIGAHWRGSAIPSPAQFRAPEAGVRSAV